MLTEAFKKQAVNNKVGSSKFKKVNLKDSKNPKTPDKKKKKDIDTGPSESLKKKLGFK